MYPRYLTKVENDENGNVAKIPTRSEPWQPTSHKLKDWRDFIVILKSEADHKESGE
jgi:hypothetical protein